MKNMKFLAVAVLGLAPLMAQAEDNWACEVVLCLANPNGATAVTECVKPIKKLYKELAKGNPFPYCNMNSNESQGNSANHTKLNEKNCPSKHKSYDQGKVYCDYRGVINVKLAGKPFTRVYWGDNGSYTENLGYTPPVEDIPAEETPQPGQVQK